MNLIALLPWGKCTLNSINKWLITKDNSFVGEFMYVWKTFSNILKGPAIGLLGRNPRELSKSKTLWDQKAWHPAQYQLNQVPTCSAAASVSGQVNPGHPAVSPSPTIIAAPPKFAQNLVLSQRSAHTLYYFQLRNSDLMFGKTHFKSSLEPCSLTALKGWKTGHLLNSSSLRDCQSWVPPAATKRVLCLEPLPYRRVC